MTHDVEVLVRWGVSTLHVSHERGPRAFALGDVPVLVPRGGGVALAVHPGASGTIDLPGQGTIEIHDVATSVSARPFREAAFTPSAMELVDLPLGARARIELDGLVLEIAITEPTPPPRRERLRIDRVAAVVMALSLVCHVSVVSAGAHSMPAMAYDQEELPVERSPVLVAQRAFDWPIEDLQDEEEEHACLHHEIGARGTPIVRDRGQWGVQGPQDNPDPHLSRTRPVVDLAPRQWSIGLDDPADGDTHAYTMPWARDDALGSDEKSARGRMFSATIQDSAGDTYDVSPRHRRPPEDEDDDDVDLSQRPLGCVLSEL